MSSVRDEPAASLRVREAIDRGLLDGMHAMAQPLTILQSRIESAMLLEEDGGAAPELLDTMAGEVERLGALLHSLQQLVAARSWHEAASPVEPRVLLDPVLEEVATLFDRCGLPLDLDLEAALPPVLVAPGPMRQILLTVLLAAQSMADRGDQMNISVGAARDAVELRVQNRSGHARPHRASLSAPFRLSMAIAEVRTLGQQGDFLLETDPFDVRIRLPLAAVS